MTHDKSAPPKDDLSFIPGKEELNRILLTQFYEDSVRRYGLASDQARKLSRLQCPAGPDWSKKTAN
jgi:hypothetical protein